VEAWKQSRLLRAGTGLGLCQVCKEVWTSVAGLCGRCEWGRDHPEAPRG